MRLYKKMLFLVRVLLFSQVEMTNRQKMGLYIMNLHKKTICRLVVAIIVVLLPGAALAGTFTQTFRNGFETDAIYLFLYDDEPNPKVLFEQVTFNSASWSIADQSNPNTYLKLTGDAAFDSGNLRMTITLSDGPSANFTTPFSLEWAEYLNGAPSASDAMGTITRQGKR
jgi:hypothetical protein